MGRKLGRLKLIEMVLDEFEKDFDMIEFFKMIDVIG